jgi:hypothetical protein
MRSTRAIAEGDCGLIQAFDAQRRHLIKGVAAKFTQLRLDTSSRA